MTRTTTERGYGAQHQRIRAALTPIVNAGDATCWRCGRTIVPGTPWDVGHDDEDRSLYRGPEHTTCNRGEPSKRRGRQTRARRPQWSRRW